MKSAIELEIDAPRERVAELFTDPRKNTKWMDGVDRVETISGQPGMPGSRYRLVPRKGKMVFVATVLARDLPAEVRLSLEASNVTVSVKATFSALPSGGTRLRSEEEFRFQGPFHKVFGFLSRGAIRGAHRRHMNAFRRFAESGG